MSDRPYVDFQEVKDKVSIPDVLEKLGIREQFRERKGVLVGVCPFPQHLHGPKPNPDQFVIDNKNDGLWLFKCFGDCDCGGDVIRCVELHQELSPAHALSNCHSSAVRPRGKGESMANFLSWEK